MILARLLDRQSCHALLRVGAIVLLLVVPFSALVEACPKGTGDSKPGKSGSSNPVAPRLKPLSAAALQRQTANFQQWIQSDLDLLGLGKITRVGVPIPQLLETFRQSWAAADPAIAPFLGSWAKDWDMMPHNFMTIFPSTVSGQVCLVRYRQMETDTVPFQTITTPLEFSVAQVVEGQLLSRTTQSARSLLRRMKVTYVPVPYEAEFLGTLEANGDLRVYGAQGLPAIDTTWNPSLLQQLKVNRCQDQPAPTPGDRS